jgi:hypothetical protein
MRLFFSTYSAKLLILIRWRYKTMRCVMKINEKILSLPPYISTSWKNIVSIHVETRPYGHILLIELVTGSKVEIPNLDPKIMEQVFAMHASAIEQEGQKNIATQTFSFPLPLEGLTSIMQHSPEQADSPPLPQEMIDKLKGLREILPEEAMAKPEPHCNCPYCQIARAISGEEAPLPVEEIVSDEDLKFRTFDIKQESDKLYSVTNPLDGQHYRVFLGEPLGCTCGSKNCEHIQAVLKS